VLLQLQVQLTDFENAAFVVFIVLITRVILSFRLNLVIPISKASLLRNKMLMGLMRDLPV
jgi:hypothetical protein